MNSSNLSAQDTSSQFVHNLVHFGRLLRSAGLPIGTGRILDAVRAVSLAGFEDREDFYWTLHAVLVSHPRQRYIFDQAFEVFWRNHRMLEKSISGLLPEVRVPEQEDSKQEMARRLSESLYLDQAIDSQSVENEQEWELKASATSSDREKLQKADFESMSKQEMESAMEILAKIRVAFDQIQTRRQQIHSLGNKVNMRKTMMRSMRGGADSIKLVRSRNRRQSMPVVILCDISGSMSEYSRVVLHFSHVMGLARSSVWSFVFGTRLTNISRYLKIRDVDCALNMVSESVEDWYGGTRIAECMAEFNRTWIRRLPLHKSIVLLVTDGLDRSESGSLEFQISLLHRSCRQLLWLNPLLRYGKFEPKVNSIRTILRNVDAFLPVHNLESLNDLAKLLCTATDQYRLETKSNREFWRSKMQEDNIGLSLKNEMA